MKPRKALLAAALLLLCGAMFFAGLRPHGFRFRNDVMWIGTENGLRLGRIGIAFTPKAPGPRPGQGDSVSVEIALKFHGQAFRRFSTILCLWEEGNPVSYALSQWNRTLVVGRSRKGFFRKTIADFGKGIEPGKESFITVTSRKGEGTALYLDGRREGFTPAFSFADAEALGRLVVGNSATARNSWRGEIYTLSISGERFTDEQVLERYLAWEGTRALPPSLSAVAAYAFDERTGESARDGSGRFADLRIPGLFHIPEKEILTMPWKDFIWSRSFASDAMINILGFIPFGFIFRALMGSLGAFFRRRALLLTLLSGGAISLVFELGQVYLPTRASQMSDLILNILGTLIGALAARIVFPSLRPFRQDPQEES